MADLFDGARVLITGGTGSLGQTLVRRLLRGDLGVPAKLIVFSRDEAKQHTVAGASEDHVDAASAVDPRRRRAVGAAFDRPMHRTGMSPTGS